MAIAAGTELTIHNAKFGGKGLSFHYILAQSMNSARVEGSILYATGSCAAEIADNVLHVTGDASAKVKDNILWIY